MGTRVIADPFTKSGSLAISWNQICLTLLLSRQDWKDQELGLPRLHVQNEEVWPKTAFGTKPPKEIEKELMHCYRMPRVQDHSRTSLVFR